MNSIHQLHLKSIIKETEKIIHHIEKLQNRLSKRFELKTNEQNSKNEDWQRLEDIHNNLTKALNQMEDYYRELRK